MSLKTKQLFEKLSWSEAALYASMLLMSVALPISWRLGLMSMIIMTVAAVVNAIVKQSLFNQNLTKRTAVAYVLMMFFWCAWFASAFWSSNQPNAWHVVGVKLPLLIMPIVFILGETSFLTQKHIQTLFSALCATLIVRFIVILIRDIIIIAQGGTLLYGNDLMFDPLHHNYLALYLLTAIAFLYTEIVIPRNKRMLRMPLWCLFSIIALFIVYIIVIASRSGLVALLLLGLACVAHATFYRRMWRATLIVVGVIAVGIIASYIAFPNLYYRIMCTVRNLMAGNGGNDVRIMMDGCGLQVFRTSPIIGVGCGDVWQMLQQVFLENGFEEGSVRDFDSHNQYLETMMATGIVGFVSQIAMMAAPVVVALREQRGRTLASLLTIVFAVCIFFEATFGRQMGLLFVVWWMCVSIINTRCEE